MKYYYSLRIVCEDRLVSEINKILKVESNYPVIGWGYELVQNEDDDYIDFINVFLDILKDKFSQLKNIGIARDCISIWMIYEYNQQCNLEFLPMDLKRLGDDEITLCISCYETKN